MAKQRREKQQELIKAKRALEEKKWAELHQKQKIEAEKRMQKMQLVDAERIEQMKMKDASERLQRQVVLANKLASEKNHEMQVKSMIDKYEYKQMNSKNKYVQNLD